jgi:hypothetical protein
MRLDACNASRRPVKHFSNPVPSGDEDGQQTGRWDRRLAESYSVATSQAWSSERFQTMDIWDFLTNTWWPFIIGGVLIVALLGVFIFMRMKKTDD